MKIDRKENGILEYGGGLLLDMDRDGMIMYKKGEGLWYRYNGPAIIFGDGDRYNSFNGRMHREEGPAVIFEDGTVEYWVDGEKVG